MPVPLYGSIPVGGCPVGASGHIYAIGRYPVGVVDLAGDGDDVRRIVSIGKSDYEFIGVLLADLSRRDKQFQQGIGRTKTDKSIISL